MAKKKQPQAEPQWEEEFAKDVGRERTAHYEAVRNIPLSKRRKPRAKRAAAR